MILSEGRMLTVLTKFLRQSLSEANLVAGEYNIYSIRIGATTSAMDTSISAV